MGDWTLTTNPESGTSGTTNLTITSSSVEEGNNLAYIKLCNTEKAIDAFVVVGIDDEKFSVNYLDCQYTGTTVRIVSSGQETNITGYSVDSGQTIIQLTNETEVCEFQDSGLHSIRLYMAEGANKIMYRNFVYSDIYSIVFPSFIEEIEDEAFARKESPVIEIGAPYLHHVEFSNHLKRIGDYAFYRCPIEGSLFLPPSIEYVGDGCFFNSSIQYASIYAKELGDSSFSSIINGGLLKVYFGPSVRKIGDYAFGSMNAAAGPHMNIGEIIFTDGLEYIGDYAFSNCHITCRIVLPSSLLYLGDNVFYAYHNLYILNKGIYVGNGSKCLPKKNFFENNPDYYEDMPYFDVEIPYGIACLKASLFDYRPLSLLNVPEKIANMPKQVKISLANTFLGSNRYPPTSLIPSGETILHLLRTTYQEYKENDSHVPYSSYEQYFTAICDFVVPDNFCYEDYDPSWRVNRNLPKDGIIFTETTTQIGHRISYVTDVIYAYPTTPPTTETDSFIPVDNPGTITLHYPQNSDYSSWVTMFENMGYTVIGKNDL